MELVVDIGHMFCFVGKAFNLIKQLYSDEEDSLSKDILPEEASKLLNLLNATHLSTPLEEYAQCVYEAYTSEEVRKYSSNALARTSLLHLRSQIRCWSNAQLMTRKNDCWCEPYVEIVIFFAVIGYFALDCAYLMDDQLFVASADNT